MKQISFNVQFSNIKQGSVAALAPMAVEILLCRCSAQKIEAYSGKKLLKNNSIHNQP